MAADPDKPSLSERFTRAVIKADNRERPESDGPETVEELEDAVARMDDRERLIGLAAAPLAGVVAIIVVSTYGTKAGKAPSAHASLALALFALALVALACAWFRKRLYLGVVFALYGLSVFNLHYWGFGVPFLLIGSWYLVRAYRLQQKLKVAKEEGVTGSGSGSGGTARRAQPNKRYTPPVAPPPKPTKPTKPTKPAKPTKPPTSGGPPPGDG
jgi:hypothetical protein